MIRDNSEELNFFFGLINKTNLFNRPLTILDETDIVDFFKNLRDVKELKLQDNILPCNSMTLIAVTIQAAIDIRD